MNTEVRISDSALESMVLAACEAFVFGNNNENEPVETYGHVWGYRRLSPDGTTEHIHVDRFNACVSAEGSHDGVEVGHEVVDLQDSIVRHWSPHLSLLGDFHTHPYKSRNELASNRGWQFSEHDHEWFLSDDSLWKRAGNTPIAFVMAMAPLERVNEGWVEEKAPNRWRFSVGEYRFYLSAVMGRMDDKGKRCTTRGDLELALDWRFYNEAENRLANH